MDNKYPKAVEDYTTANLVLIFVNLLWIFVAMWSAWGIGPVLIAAAVMNHLITRLKVVRRRREARFDRA